MIAETERRNLITMKAALEKGGFKKTKCYELINNGTLYAYKMGGQTMIDADTIEAYHLTLDRIMPKAPKEKAAP
jgi:hypothetical protein